MVDFFRWVVDGHFWVGFVTPRLPSQPAIHNFRLYLRHFYQYEAYDAVRAMEMKEARDDNVFATLHSDPQFREITALARSAYLVGAEFCSPEALLNQATYEGPPMRPLD